MLRTVLVAGMAFLPACETGHGSLRPAPGVQVVEGGDADGVALLREAPAGGFEVLGIVSAHADARFEGRIDAARASAERVLRTKAAAVGADAVIVDEALVAEIPGDGYAADDLGSSFGDGFGAGSGNLQRPAGGAVLTRPVHRVVLRGRAVRLRATVGG